MNSYKDSIKSGDPLGLVGAFVGNAIGQLGLGGKNPLEEGQGEYEKVNRDSGECFSLTYPPVEFRR